jgi:two-component system phosphate regulon response regulator PhoB
MISGYGDSQNIIYGLDLWADDYLTKPLIPEELIARVKAILRRPPSIRSGNIIKYKDISFNPLTAEVFIGDRPVYLTKNENRILGLLMSEQGKIVSREDLIVWVWGGHTDEDVSDNTINVTLSKIRKKLEGNFVPKTIYNQGYILE